MTVKVDLKSHDMNMGDRLHDYITSKAERLDKYIHNIEGIAVELRHRERARRVEDRYRAQITLLGKGYTLRAEESSEDAAAAFDRALDNLKRRIERYKGKHFRGRGDGKSIAEEAIEQLETAIELEQEPEPVIQRRKHMMLIPMDEYEAIEQANLLGHQDFFVFYNANTSNVNVLYRRHDGSYGLIETEVG
jgi:putative sigma-54 modulation protein